MTNLQHKNNLSPGVWKTFTSDPSTGVSIVSVDGTVLYFNRQITRFMYGKSRDPKSCIGKSFFDLGVPEEWAAERVALFKRVRESGRPILLRTVWNGRQQFSWISPINSDGQDDHDRVLVIVRRVPASEEAEHLLEGEYEIVNSEYIGLGELDPLTPREIEVLALLGQGMSIKEIAGTLFRSVKTIENHRESIGRKLNKHRGVDIASIAHAAGLVVADSSRTRLEP